MTPADRPPPPPPGPDAVEDAQRALVGRPRRSARAAIIGGFSVSFLLVCGVTVAAVLVLLDLRERIRFLEHAGDFEVALLEARRAEKNYLFFGVSRPAEARADLDEAVEQARRARSLAEDVVQGSAGSSEPARWRQALSDVEAYQARIEALVGPADEGAVPGPAAVQVVREAGRRVQHDASSVLGLERDELDRLVDRCIVFAGLFVVASLLIVVAIASTLLLRILRPISRFVAYTQRIARGDFSPIQPARRYRDEFSGLAVAFNAMLRELAARQEQITRAGKLAALGTLTSGMAHELNNPLNNISLTTEALLEGFGHQTPDEQRKLLEEIFTQVDRASGTVRNLLDFTRMDRPRFVATSVLEVVRRAAQLVGNEAKLGQVEVRLEVPEDLPPIRACTRDLEQVFLNLFLNAIQAMPQGGRLTVGGRRAAGAEVEIDVADTGLGIPAENLEQIFDPFFTTKEVGVGTGLGLTVTHRLVENHGGRIAVRSRVGEGTVFTVVLPIGGPGARAPANERERGS